MTGHKLSLAGDGFTRLEENRFRLKRSVTVREKGTGKELLVSEYSHKIPLDSECTVGTLFADALDADKFDIVQK